MIRAFRHEAGRLISCAPEADERSVTQAVWIDLFSPDDAEIARLAAMTGIELPTPADMAEIEPSSRLYVEGAAGFMTATLPVGSDGPEPGFAPVTFVLTPGALVTLRYHTPMPFRTYPERAGQTSMPPETPQGVLLGLLDEIVDRIADLLERTSGEIDQQSRAIFAAPRKGEVRSDDFERALTTIGGRADYVARLRACLVSLDRMLGFLAQRLQQRGAADAGKATREAARAALKTQQRDVAALTQHADALTQQTTLLLDATLGLINIEQAKIIKIFSVVAFVMLPPTLIASIYGMNFEHMPELGWRFGYPAALGAMVVSAVLPYLYFKRKGWL